MIEGPRSARFEELPAVIGLSNAVFSPGGDVDLGRAFPTLFAKDNTRNLAALVFGSVERRSSPRGP